MKQNKNSESSNISQQQDLNQRNIPQHSFLIQKVSLNLKTVWEELISEAAKSYQVKLGVVVDAYARKRVHLLENRKTSRPERIQMELE